MVSRSVIRLTPGHRRRRAPRNSAIPAHSLVQARYSLPHHSTATCDLPDQKQSLTFAGGTDGGGEVVCVARPRTNPPIRSRVIVLPGATGEAAGRMGGGGGHRLVRGGSGFSSA